MHAILNKIMYIWHMLNTKELLQGLQKEIDRIASFDAPPSKSVIEEAAATYGSISFEKLFDRRRTVLSLIKNGMSTEYFFSLVSATPFSLTDWCTVTNIPYRTMLRYQKEPTILKPIYTEKVLAFVEVIELGLEVFGSADKFQHWLYNKKFIFNDMRPIDMMQSSYGKDMVITELHHIDHGIFA